MQHSRDQTYGTLSRYVTTCSNVAGAMRKKELQELPFVLTMRIFMWLSVIFFKRKKKGGRVIIGIKRSSSVYHRKQ